MLLRSFLAGLILGFPLASLAAGKPVVYSANYPLHYFTQRIAGPIVEAVYPVPDAIDPAFWQPGISAIQAFQQADMIIINGAGYSKWLQKVSLPRKKLINTSKAFKQDYIYEKRGSSHSHGIDGAHSHSGTAFTTWMDMTQARQQALAIRDALIKNLPEYSQTFASNYQVLSKDLMLLDQQWQSQFQAIQEETILASHPVYQYLARRYQLNIISMQWEPDSYPDEQQWLKLKKRLDKHPAKLMLWEDNPLPETKTRLEKSGITVVKFSQAGNRPKQGDWLEVMYQNSDSLKRILKRID